jgi:hypothetical protein
VLIPIRICHECTNDERFGHQTAIRAFVADNKEKFSGTNPETRCLI